MTAENKPKQPKVMPAGRPFQKGVSGNPGGRPRVVKDIQALAREHTDTAVAALVAALDNPRERVAAAQALLDRGYGKPTQKQEVTGAEGGPIQTEAHSTVETRPPIGEFMAAFLARRKAEK